MTPKLTAAAVCAIASLVAAALPWMIDLRSGGLQYYAIGILLSAVAFTSALWEEPGKATPKARAWVTITALFSTAVALLNFAFVYLRSTGRL
jgi:hypothetical protein